MSPVLGRRARGAFRDTRATFAGMVAAIAVAATPVSAAIGQGPQLAAAPTEIERRLADEPFQITGMQDNRWQGDRTQRTALRFPDGTDLNVKWARAAPGGFAINNQPRYEVAAFQLQKLFLDEDDWVVPPTVLRELSVALYRQMEPQIEPTFEGTRSVLVAVQYWLDDVEYFDRPDPERLAGDDTYARRFAQLNLFTHLIRHVDANPGNVLIATTGEPRMYAVDNGVAFRSPESPRGTYWRDLHTDRLPADAIERIRGLTRERLDSALAVVAQFRVREDGRLEAVPLTAKRDPNRGVHHHDGIVQFGLTNLELDELWGRCQALLRRVDAGDIQTF